jgi:two-component system sensor histidine kinase GlrK
MKWTILKRLTVGYLAILVVVVFMGGVVTYKLNQLNHITRQIDSVLGTTIRESELLGEALISQVGFEKKYYIARDPDFYDQFWKIKSYFLSRFEALRPLMTNPKKLAMFNKIEDLYNSYLSSFKERANQVPGSSVAASGVSPAAKDGIADKIQHLLKEIIRLSKQSRDEKIQESGRIANQVLKITIVAAALVILIGSLIAFLNTRVINRSISLLQEHTREIAKGSFEPIRNITSPLEIKELADDFNLMCSRLRELDEMKIDFISHVSHELRTPLTAIKEASSMLLEGTYAQFPEKEQELLAITKEECERLISSVNRILDLSRMEANMMEYHFSVCNLPPVVKKVVTRLMPIAQSRHLSISLDFQEELPPVLIDAPRIEQVLENLLGNALKFTSDHDTITIKAGVQPSSEKFIEVAVADTGSGMAKENLEKIFDKFHRIEDGRETVRGTGLGLPIAKHIVAAHGGIIWAESEAGRCSTFYFTLPVV